MTELPKEPEQIAYLEAALDGYSKKDTIIEYCKALRAAAEALRKKNDALMELAVKRAHDECEDPWYSCPKSKDGSPRINPGDELYCNCGADDWNKTVDAALAVAARKEGK